MHAVLLGDSIFDNASYVPGGLAVIDHLRQQLAPAGQATLLAVDGAVIESVHRQTPRIPADATHLVVSVGGNDVLGYGAVILNAPASSFLEVLSQLDEMRGEFRRHYRAMLDVVLARELPTVVCTVYDGIPGLSSAEVAGLAMFNEVILKEAFRSGLPVIDLRLVCDEAADYSSLSPIEPSAAGGGKIARLIAYVLANHDFRTPRVVFR